MFQLLLDHHQVHKELKYAMCNKLFVTLCIFQLFVDLMMVE